MVDAIEAIKIHEARKKWRDFMINLNNLQGSREIEDLLI